MQVWVCYGSSSQAHDQALRWITFRAARPAALSTGCRVVELLTLKWEDVQINWNGAYRALTLQATKTKTGITRVVPVGHRLAAVLEMVRTDPEGENLRELPSCSAMRLGRASRR